MEKNKKRITEKLEEKYYLWKRILKRIVEEVRKKVKKLSELSEL